MVGRGAASTTPYCPRPILRGVWRVRVQPHVRIWDGAGLPPHNRFPHLSGLLFLANINRNRLFFFLVGLCDALCKVKSFVRFQDIGPASRRPDFPVYGGGHTGGRLTDQSSHITFCGESFQSFKNGCHQAEPLYTLAHPLPCHLMTAA